MAFQPSILVVDDDAATRRLVCDMLAAHRFYVIEAANGREALAWLDGLRPDLILLDLVMPVMDGWQFLRQHRDNPQHSMIPVIVVTGVASNDRRCVEMPLVRVLPKPFTEAQLVAAILEECPQTRS